MPFAGDARQTVVDAHLYGAIGGLALAFLPALAPQSRSDAVVILRAHVKQLTRIRISRTGLPGRRHDGEARRANPPSCAPPSTRRRRCSATTSGSCASRDRLRSSTPPNVHSPPCWLRASPPGACGGSASGAAPSIVTGHSLGEFTALVAADAIDFATCVDLVRFRGKVMQEAVPAGHAARWRRC